MDDALLLARLRDVVCCKTDPNAIEANFPLQLDLVTTADTNQHLT